MTAPIPEAFDTDVRHWISFEDDEEQRTWMFDRDLLWSNLTCIYGRGCQGVLAEPAADLDQGCCSFGAHFVDDEDVAHVVKAFVELDETVMEYYHAAVADGFLAADDSDTESDDTPATVTRVVDDACIFLNRPGFAGGVGCALHIAATAAGARPMDWKPNVCWQVPIRLEHFTDDNGHVVSRLRPWERRDWGGGGADFAWWCTEAPEAYVGSDPVYLAARDEIVELVGVAVYERLVGLLESARSAPVTIRKSPRRGKAANG